VCSGSVAFSRCIVLAAAQYLRNFSLSENMHLERLWLTPKFTASPMKLSHFDVIRASGDLLWPAGSVLYCRLTTDPRVHINHCLFDERDGFCRISRLSRHDTTINGLTIPKGTIIQMLIHTVHHDEDYWPNPDQFDPER